MTKIIDLNNKNLQQIQDLVDKNPDWQLITCGTTRYSETYKYKSMSGANVMTSDPPENHYFAVFQRQSGKSEFKL